MQDGISAVLRPAGSNRFFGDKNEFRNRTEKSAKDGVKDNAKDNAMAQKSDRCSVQ